MTKTHTKTYHIYLNDKCLFKNLSEDEFNMIWNKLYTSYSGSDIAQKDQDHIKLADNIGNNTGN